jgi:hypothetical protein
MKEVEHDYTDEIVCPYCGYEFSESYEFGDGFDEDLDIIDCGECEESFYASRSIMVNYSTEKLEKGTCKYCGKENVGIENYISSIGKLIDVGIECCKQNEITKLRKEYAKKF